MASKKIQNKGELIRI